MNIMDYSLMIGVHDIVRGNKDNVRDSTLQFFQVRIDFRVTHFHMLWNREFTRHWRILLYSLIPSLLSVVLQWWRSAKVRPWCIVRSLWRQILINWMLLICLTHHLKSKSYILIFHYKKNNNHIVLLGVAIVPSIQMMVDSKQLMKETHLFLLFTTWVSLISLHLMISRRSLSISSSQWLKTRMKSLP